MSVTKKQTLAKAWSMLESPDLGIVCVFVCMCTIFCILVTPALFSSLLSLCPFSKELLMEPLVDSGTRGLHWAVLFSFLHWAVLSRNCLQLRLITVV